jgi:chitinase
MKRTRLVAAFGTALLVSGAVSMSLPTSPAQAEVRQAAVACDAPAWSASAVYTANQKVTYGAHLWTAKW